MTQRTLEKMSVDVSVSPDKFKEGVVMPQQSHGNRVTVVETGNENLEDCDAVVTGNRNLSLGIRTADCAPVCFSDGKTIAIAHVGWRGLCAGILENVLTYFDTRQVEVFVGPHLQEFEIQKDFCYDAIMRKFGNTFIDTTDNGLQFRFTDAIRSCLPANVVVDERTTATDLTLPSYRFKRMCGHIITIVEFPKYG